MTEPIIKATNVSKVLGSGPAKVQALKGVSITLKGGKLTVLIGPSGSGKTTLLSILGCMLAPTEGTVRICGTAINGARPEDLAQIRRQHIGFVFQSYHLFSTLTAAENVRLALDVRDEGGPRAIAKTEKVLASVGLASLLSDCGENCHDSLPIVGIQRRGRFVREYGRRLRDNSSGYCNPLLFTAAELAGERCHFRREPDACLHLLGFRNRSGPTFVPDIKRQSNVFGGGEGGNK